MFHGRYFPERYFPTRYWAKIGTAIEVCVYVQGPRNRYGTKKKYRTCIKYGDGFSDPWFPIGEVDPRYQYEDGTSVLDRNDDTLLSIDNRNILSVDFGSVLNEVFYLQSPNGSIWEVTIHGDTGAINVLGGTSTGLLTGSALQLAMLESDIPWEPGLPLSPATIDEPIQRILLWGYPHDEGAGEALSGSPIRKLIVSLEGELFQLKVLDTGELQFTNDIDDFTDESAYTPTFTEE